MSCSGTECLWKRAVSGTESGPWAAVDIVGIASQTPSESRREVLPFPVQTTPWALRRGHWLRVGLPRSFLEALAPSWPHGPVGQRAHHGASTPRPGGSRGCPSLWRQDGDRLGVVQPLRTADCHGAHLFLSCVLCCQQKLKQPFTHLALEAASCGLTTCLCPRH